VTPSPVEHAWPHDDHWVCCCLECIKEGVAWRQLADGRALTAQVGVGVGQVYRLTNQANLWARGGGEGGKGGDIRGAAECERRA
jgi:hypothetical protein